MIVVFAFHFIIVIMEVIFGIYLNSQNIFFFIFVLKHKASGYRLNIRLNEYNKSSIVVWSLVDTQSNPLNEWKLGQIFYKTDDNYRLYIEEVSGTDSKNYAGNQFKISNNLLLKQKVNLMV